MVRMGHMYTLDGVPILPPADSDGAATSTLFHGKCDATWPTWQEHLALRERVERLERLVEIFQSSGAAVDQF